MNRRLGPRDSDFSVAMQALADERYAGRAQPAFAHLAFQMTFPTFNFSDDAADEATSVDRRGDLGADAVFVADEERQILLFQAKSSPGLTDTEVHDFITAFLGVPNKLDSNGWVAKAHREMKTIANDFRVAKEDGYEVIFGFASMSPISSTVRSAFEDRPDLMLLNAEDLDARYRKVILGEYGNTTDVRFAVGRDQIHQPPSLERVLYLTLSAREYVNECKKYEMELFRYNPRLYLGSNKVNQRIAQTVADPTQRPYFHLLNNGITAVCKKFDVVDAGSAGFVVNVEDFQVVNGCQTTITLLRNSANLIKDDCSVDVKIIQSEGLRNLISEATNTQTAIFAEDAFSNEAEQLRIQQLLDRHDPPYFYAPKRGAWEKLSSVKKRSYLDAKPVFGRYRKLTSKELAAVCLAIFGHPESAKDKPRIVFEKQAGQNSGLYGRVFLARNSSDQWILPFELLRHANAMIKAEAAVTSEAEKASQPGNGWGETEIDRARVGEYGRYRMIDLAYRFLKIQYRESSDFLSATTSRLLLESIKAWAPSMLEITLEALVASFLDANRRGEMGGLREFFRETRQEQTIMERFRMTLATAERKARRAGTNLPDDIGLPKLAKR